MSYTRPVARIDRHAALALAALTLCLSACAVLRREDPEMAAVRRAADRPDLVVRPAPIGERAAPAAAPAAPQDREADHLPPPPAEPAAPTVGPSAAAGDPAIAEAHAALVALFRGEADGLARAHAFFERVDADRVRHGQPPTGLTDQILDLRNALIPSRRGYLRALREALDHDPDPQLRQRIEWRLAADEVVVAEGLLRDARHNRVAGLINDAVRPLGNWTLPVAAAINPVLLGGALVDAVASTASNLWHWGRIRTEEREALARYRQHLRRGAEPEVRSEAIPAVRRLRERAQTAECERLLDAAREAAASDDAALARLHLRATAALPGCEVPSTLEAAGDREPGESDGSLWPRDPLPEIPVVLRPDYQRLLVALLTADPPAIRSAADELRRRHPKSELTDETAYAETVAADLDGEHEMAITAMRRLAGESGNMGRHAAVLLDDPAYDRFAGVRAALARHRRARLRYVLFGSRPNPRTALYGAAQLGASGLRAAESLGILNVVALTMRAVRAWRHDPISNRPIIVAGEALLDREPRSPHRSEVREVLAAAYARERDYGRALFHYRRTEHPRPRRVRRLTAQLADGLLETALATPTAERRRVLLTLVERGYPDTGAAVKARAALAELGAPEGSDLTIAVGRLRDHPGLSTRLGLPVQWVDGVDANGEVAPPGVRLLPPDGAIVALATPAGTRDERLELDADRLTALVAALSEAAYQDAAAQASAEGGSRGLERFIPIFVQGSVGESGISLYPGIKPRRSGRDDPRLYE
jgi:hypothetical protein